MASSEFDPGAGIVAQILTSPAEGFLNSLYDGIVEAVLAVSLQSDQIVYWNKGAETQFGYRADEVLKQSAVLLYPDEESFQRMAAIARPVLDKCGSWAGEWQLKRRNESIFPADVTFSVFRKDDKGEGSYAVIVIRDITDRKAAAAALTRQQDMLRLHRHVAAAAAQARHWTDAMRVTLEYFCTYENWAVGHAVLHEACHSPTASTRSVWYTSHPDAEKIESFKRFADAGKMRGRRGFLRRVFVEGKPQWIADISNGDMPRRCREAAQAAGLKSTFGFAVVVGNRVVARLELFDDETREPDAMLIEAAESLGTQLGRVFERHEMENKLRECEQMAEVGLTVSKIVHEIGNPLNGMYTTAQLLERYGKKHSGEPIDGNICAMATTLINETDRLKSLLEELSLFAASASVELVPCDMAALTRNVLQEQAVVFREAGIRLRTEFASNVPLVRADPERLRQALIHLLTNAVEAMPEGGQLTLRLGAQDNGAFVEIMDTGVGVPEGLAIFDLFTTTKASHRGLGLALAKQIVAAHGGRLDASSGLGKNTTFRLMFRCAGEELN